MITIHALTMQYGSFKALDAVSFDIRQGEVLGLLGPNGAGKTTLMRVLTTYLYPTGGSVTVDGVNPIEHPIQVRRRIGYLPETVPLYLDMSVDEYLSFVGRARGMDGTAGTGGATLAERLDWLRTTCGLVSVWKQPLIELSKGFRQRVGLAQALVHDPDVLILDEPTSGLDPLQIIEIRDLIRRLAAHKTIVFSTHILQEVEALADRIVIINRGRIVAQGTKAELLATVRREQRLTCVIESDASVIQSKLGALSGVRAVECRALGQGRCKVSVTFDGSEAVIRQLDALIKAERWPLLQFAQEPPSLEDAFIALLSGARETSP